MNVQFPLITIIVPMHNSANYISRCVNSILNQSYEHFELLLVDDHSSDDTLIVCQNFLIDSRITIIKNNRNNGVSTTRNVGIKHAKGDYISFVDSDDVISPHYLSKLIKKAQQYPDYLPMCGYTTFQNNNIHFIDSLDTKQLLISSNVIIDNIFYYHPSAWACLFRKDLIIEHQIFMEEQASFNEDVYFTCKYLSIVNGALVIEDKLYGYYINPNGLGANKAHAKLDLNDVNHRAEGYIALQDAIKFAVLNSPDRVKNVKNSYIFIAAEVKMTAARAGVNDYLYYKEINKYLSVINRVKFIIVGKSLKQILYVNGVALSPGFVMFLLDKMNLLKLIK